jgi:hypothetical protein
MRRSHDIALFLRCCPHCLGDLELRSDSAGRYYTCLQCSTRAELPDYSERVSSLTLGRRPGFYGLGEPSR